MEPVASGAKSLAAKSRRPSQIVLETELSNKGALRLYERLGFIRAKRLYRFYLNASDAYRLVLPVSQTTTSQ